MGSNTKIFTTPEMKPTHKASPARRQFINLKVPSSAGQTVFAAHREAV